MLAYTGKTKTDRTTVDLNQLLEQLTPVIEANRPSSIQFEFHDTADPLVSDVDQTQIEQVILNLVNNAVAASDDGGKVVVRTGHESIDQIGTQYRGTQTEGGNFNFIEVEDFGHGISTDKMEQIFDPFYTDKLHGRGLGLAVVHGMIDAHDGLIKINSEAGAALRSDC